MYTSNMKSQPENFYELTNESLKSLKKAKRNGRPITALVKSANGNLEILECEIGINKLKAIIPFKELSATELKYRRNQSVRLSNIPKEATALIGKKVRAMVISVKDGEILLSRKKNMENAIKYLQENEEILKTQQLETYCTGMQKYGAFVDIAEGISGLIPIRELTATRYYKIENWIKVGEKIPAKIIKILENGRIELSRKILYNGEKYCEDEMYEVKIAGIHEESQKDGQEAYWVELDPGNAGIMDFEGVHAKRIYNFEEGQRVCAYIHKVIKKEEQKNKIRLWFIKEL